MIKNFFTNNKKILLIFSPFFALLIFLLTSVANLEFTVSSALSLFFPGTFTIGNIDLSKKNLLKVEDFRIFLNNEKILDAKDIEITYDLSKDFSEILGVITLKRPELLIARENSNINIIRAFSDGTSTDTDKSGTGIPIDKINIIDADVTFHDLSYKDLIEIKIPHIDGWVDFDKVKGIDLEFLGITNKGEKLKYTFNNEIHDYNMNINAQNFKVDTNLLQYGYYYDRIEYRNGDIDLDLTINDDGLFGEAVVKHLDVDYLDFSEPVKNVKGRVDFLGNIIKLDANFEIFFKKKNINMVFDFDNEMNLVIDLGDMTFGELSKYKVIEGLGLPIENYLIRDTKVTLKLDKYKEFYAIVDFAPEDIVLSDNLKFTNNFGQVVYNNGLTNIELSNSDMNLFGINKMLSARFNLRDKDVDIEYFVDNNRGSGKLHLREGDLGILLDSGIVELTGNYDYSDRKLTFHNREGVGAKAEDNFNFSYDFKKSNLEIFKGIVNLNFFDEYYGYLDINAKDNKGLISQFNLYDINNIALLESSGDFDLNSKKYNYTFETFKLPYSGVFGANKVEIEVSAGGVLKGVGSDFVLDSEGTVERLAFGDIEVNGIKSSVRVDKNHVEVLDISNNFLNLSGVYTFGKNDLNFRYEVNNLNENSFEVPPVDFRDYTFNIANIKGVIKGSIDNPEGSINIEGGEFNLPNEEVLKISGSGNLLGSTIHLNDLIINDTTKVSGKYNLKENSYSLLMYLYEENLPKYFGDVNFKVRSIGKFALSGVGKEVFAKGDFSLDKLYLRGTELPKVYGSLEYSANDLTNGILNIDNLELDRNENRILNVNGNIDLGMKYLDLTIDEDNVDLKEAVNLDVLSGDVSLNAFVKGNFSDIKYGVKLLSDGVSLDEFQLTDFIVESSGDLENVKLDKFTFKYEDNAFLSNGFYNIKSGDYQVKLNSSEISLIFLQPLLEKYGVNSVDGSAEFNLLLNNDENKGDFVGKNISFALDEYGISGDRINFDFEFGNQKFFVKQFNGIVNDGNLALNGYLTLPSLDKISKDPYFFEKLDYELNLASDDVKYKIPGYLTLEVDSDLKLSDNKISGKLDIVRGEVTGIPGVDSEFNIFTVIQKFIFDEKVEKVEAAVALTDSVDYKKSIKNNLAVDVDLRIVEGIELKIPSVLSILENINGKLVGGGNLSGKSDTLNFLGEFNLKDGSFALSENDFEIAEIRLLFSDPSDYFPSINPVLDFQAKSKSMMDKIDIYLNGEIKSLNFRVRTNNESSSGNLASFLSGNSDGSEGENREAIAIILKNVIDSQISETIFGPISKEIKEMLGLQKLKITSDLSEETLNRLNTTAEGSGGLTKEDTTNNNFLFGVKVQIEDKIYDKLYWLGEVKLNGTSNSSTTSGAITKALRSDYDRYNVALEYRYSDGKVFSLGAQGKDNVSQLFKNSNKNDPKKKNINYYIDFKIEKKYDSITEIFSDLWK